MHFSILIKELAWRNYSSGNVFTAMFRAWTPANGQIPAVIAFGIFVFQDCGTEILIFIFPIYIPFFIQLPRHLVKLIVIAFAHKSVGQHTFKAILVGIAHVHEGNAAGEPEFTSLVIHHFHAIIINAVGIFLPYSAKKEAYSAPGILGNSGFDVLKDLLCIFKIISGVIEAKCHR